MTSETAPIGDAVITIYRKKTKRLSLNELLPLIVIGCYVAMALLGPVFLDLTPTTPTIGDRLIPPFSSTPSGRFTLLGTDSLGRDIALLIVQGSRASLLIGTTSLTIALVFGSVIGISAGLFRGWFDGVVMRIADLQLSFPTILLAIFISSLFGASIRNIILVLAVTRWVVFARVTRAQTLSTAASDYVQGTAVLGAGRLHIVRRCLLPACRAPLLVLATVEFGLIIIAEASLSFLGLGVPVSIVSWGQMISAGRDYLGSAWWMATFPGMALAGLVLTIGILGDALRDRYDWGGK